MTRREQLTENYEDALFALLLDEVGEAEGQRLWEENERLKDDPDFQVPESLDRRCMRSIRWVFFKRHCRQALRASRKLLNMVAMLVLVVSTVFVSAYAASPDVRVQTLNLLIETSHVATSLTLVSGETKQSAADSGTLLGYKLPTLPEEYFVSYEYHEGNAASIEFSDGKVSSIWFDIMPGTSGKLNADTENSDSFEEVAVQGYDGILVEKENRVQIVWIDTTNNSCLQVICRNLDKNTALSLAEEFVYVGG